MPKTTATLGLLGCYQPSFVKEATRQDLLWHLQLAERMAKAAEGNSLKDIAAKTGFHSENVRRYMLNGRIPALFLCRFCQAFRVDPRWVMTGKGPMRPRARR